VTSDCSEKKIYSIVYEYFVYMIKNRPLEIKWYEKNLTRRMKKINMNMKWFSHYAGENV